VLETTSVVGTRTRQTVFGICVAWILCDTEAIEGVVVTKADTVTIDGSAWTTLAVVIGHRISIASVATVNGHWWATVSISIHDRSCGALRTTLLGNVVTDWMGLNFNTHVIGGRVGV